MLNLTNVSKTYPKSSAKAVDSLNLDVKDGEIFGFLGPNGAGKSTTIKLITGILNPDEGAISVDGMNIADNRVAAKKSIGYVSDNHAVYEKLTQGVSRLHGHDVRGPARIETGARRKAAGRVRSD